ncbi:MAG: hypothetical protein ACOYOV_01375 [Bacteroidales bacterium]
MKITKMLMAACILAFSVNTGFAQYNDLNNGAECGCPAVGSRTAVTLESMGTSIGTNMYEIQANTTLTCNNTYTISHMIYVGYGVTLTIQPGTVIKGALTTYPNASVLLVERGGKIIADGKANCKIIFTGINDPLDGTYAVTNVGDWGGLIMCGFATNNLKTAYNFGSGKKGAGWDGVGFCEGLDNTTKHLWGAGDTITLANGQAVSIPTTFNDNDNSGILKYVSVRHAGMLVGGSSAGNEVNGISLYSVGRGTKIEYVETVAAADDNIELFGGTVDLKHCSVLYGDDDFYDYDLGWSGRMQFCFGMAGDSLTGLHSTDNAFECDADDNASCTTFDRSHPFIYNCTLIGNGHMKGTADNVGPAAIMAKELTEGEFINNVFVNFRSGLHLNTGRQGAAAGQGGDAYDNWTNHGPTTYINATYPTGAGNAAGSINGKLQSLIVKNNTFVHCNLTNETAPNGNSFWITKGNKLTTGSGAGIGMNLTAIASAADTLQFSNDGNTHPSVVPGIDYTWSWNVGKTDFSDKYHAVPTTSLTSNMTPPNDGFFDIVSYRGAFDPSKKSWLSTDNGFMIPVADNMRSDNPTDINNDGVTDVTDFLILLGKFGQSNQ